MSDTSLYMLSKVKGPAKYLQGFITSFEGALTFHVTDIFGKQVLDEKGEPIELDILHRDIQVQIMDDDAYFDVEKGTIDYSDETLGSV